MRLPAIEAAVSPAFVRRGCVNVIGLDVIKAHVGARWDRMREMVCARLESILSHRLGPSDFFLELDDTSYVVVMPGGDPLDSQVCCLRVAYELHTSLLGRCEIEHLRIARAQSVDGGELAVGPLPVAELVELAQRAGLQEIIPEIHGRRQWRSALADAPRPDPGQRQGGSHVEFSYMPMWDVRREALTTYRCLPKRVGIGTEANADRVKEELSRTLAALYHSVAELTQRVDRGERFLIDVPVHFDVLSAPFGRMEIASACRDLPSEYRPYLLFEITDLPAGVPHSRLNELVTAVKPFAKAVMAHVPLHAHNYGAYQGAGLNAIGLTLPRNSTCPTYTIEEIDRLCAGAKRLSLMTFVLDIVRPDVLAHACDAGVNFITGPFIGGSESAPSHLKRLTRATVDDRMKGAVLL